MAFERYLAEEVAIDHGDGMISRREALRRLGLLGLGVPAASALLAACGGDGDGAGSTATTAAAAAPPGPVVETEAMTFPGPEGRTLQGAWAAAAQPGGAVLVIHENRGLTEHIRSVAGRLAGQRLLGPGASTCSPAEGGTAALGDEAAAMAALGGAPQERFVADMRAGLDELARRRSGREARRRSGSASAAAWSGRLLAAGEPRLAAAVPFYGPLPGGADFSGSPNAAVLGVYAEQDDRVNASREAATAALEQAGLTHEIVTYPGVNHAFFNDTGGPLRPGRGRPGVREGPRLVRAAPRLTALPRRRLSVQAGRSLPARRCGAREQIACPAGRYLLCSSGERRSNSEETGMAAAPMSSWKLELKDMTLREHAQPGDPGACRRR